MDAVVSRASFESVARAVLRGLLDESDPIIEPFRAHVRRSDVLFQVVFLPPTAEWALLFAQAGQSDPPFELSDLLRLTECPERRWRPLSGIVSQDSNAARRLLLDATDAIKEFGPQYLVDASAFESVRLDRSKRAAEYTASINQRPALREANAAWAEGDMQKVAVALSPFRGALPDDQERRLALAERRIAGRR